MGAVIASVPFTTFSSLKLVDALSGAGGVEARITQAYVSDQLASLLVGKPGGIGKTVTISDPVKASCMAMMDTYLTIMEPKLYPVSTELAGLFGSHIGGMIGGGGPFPSISAFVKDAGLVDAGVGLPTGAKCAVDADCASGSCPKCVATNDKNIKPFKKARMTDNAVAPVRTLLFGVGMCIKVCA